HFKEKAQRPRGRREERSHQIWRRPVQPVQQGGFFRVLLLCWSCSSSPSIRALSERPFPDESLGSVSSFRSTRMLAMSLNSLSTLSRCRAEVSRKKSKPLLSANFWPICSGISRSLSHLLPTRTRSTEDAEEPVLELLLPMAAIRE